MRFFGFLHFADNCRRPLSSSASLKFIVKSGNYPPPPHCCLKGVRLRSTVGAAPCGLVKHQVVMGATGSFPFTHKHHSRKFSTQTPSQHHTEVWGEGGGQPLVSAVSSNVHSSVSSQVDHLPSSSLFFLFTLSMCFPFLRPHAAKYEITTEHIPAPSAAQTQAALQTAGGASGAEPPEQNLRSRTSPRRWNLIRAEHQSSPVFSLPLVLGVELQLGQRT